MLCGFCCSVFWIKFTLWSVCSVGSCASLSVTLALSCMCMYVLYVLHGDLILMDLTSSTLRFVYMICCLLKIELTETAAPCCCEYEVSESTAENRYPVYIVIHTATQIQQNVLVYMCCFGSFVCTLICGSLHVGVVLCV